jgi:hypothetical protein
MAAFWALKGKQIKSGIQESLTGIWIKINNQKSQQGKREIAHLFLKFM